MATENRDELIAAAKPWVALQVRLLAKSSDPLNDARERLQRGVDVMEQVDRAPELGEERRDRLRRLWR